MKCIETSTKTMDSELDKILKELEDELEKKHQEIRLQDDKIAAIRAELAGVFKDMENTKSQRELEVAQLTEYLEKANHMLRMILDDIVNLQRELMFCQQRAEQYKVRWAKLQNTRHLGYLNDQAPRRADIVHVKRDKARAKQAIIKPRIIRVKTAAVENISSNNNNDL